MDDSELWKAHKQAAQGKRAYNRAASAKVLTDAGVAFERGFIYMTTFRRKVLFRLQMILFLGRQQQEQIS